MNITSIEALRRLYASPRERAVRKQLSALDVHCRRFIELSPFLVLATASTSGAMDASPRGGAAGFVKAAANGHLLIPDAPGNNRLDSLENIIQTATVGLLFVIPGVDETLRVNGKASISTATDDIKVCTDERRVPKVVIKVMVQEASLHCAKALMRSHLWSAEARVPRETLPTMGQMISEQTGLTAPAETREEMLKRYAADL
jgi:PPOX class probable FMN-dependent enzyme